MNQLLEKILLECGKLAISYLMKKWLKNRYKEDNSVPPRLLDFLSELISHARDRLAKELSEKEGQ